MNDKNLFGEMCRDSFLKSCDEKIKMSGVDARCSDAHYERLSEILGFNVKPRKRISKKWIVLLVAAALLLTACTAYVYRDKIKGLFIEKYANYDKISEADAANEVGKNAIKDIYALGYIPDGFVLREEQYSLNRTYYEYRDASENMLAYSQRVSFPTGIFDNRANKLITIDDSIEVYCTRTKEYYYYAWYDNKYYSLLVTSEEISKDELSRIVENIKIK